MIGQAVLDGRTMPLDDVRLALTDAGVSRGDGAFETVGVWGGQPFRLGDHLLRLQETLRVMALPAANLDVIIHEVETLLDGLTGDAAVRIYLTASGTRVVTVSALPDRAPVRTLTPVPAPWISPAGMPGAKTMSYAANMRAQRLAQDSGADDALLVSVPDTHVLEGPTFGLVFVTRGVLHVPSVELGIVDSVSRRTVIEAAEEVGIDVVEGSWPLKELAGAHEVLVSSALRPLTAIRAIRDWTYGRHPVGDQLGAALDRARGVSG